MRLRSKLKAHGSQSQNITGGTPDSARLGALELGPEIMDTEAFFGVCQNRPDEALLKISKVEKGIPELGEAFPVPLFKFLALAREAMIACESNGHQPDAHVRSLCVECLHAYLRPTFRARNKRLWRRFPSRSCKNRRRPSLALNS